MKFNYLFGIIFLITLSSCVKEIEDYEKLVDNPSLFHEAMEKYTDVIVHDIFSPPVASRNYVYPSIAAYEVLKFSDPQAKSFVGQLRGLESLPSPGPDNEISISLAALQSFHLVSKALIFSEDSLTISHQIFLDGLVKKGFPKKVFENSLEFADKMKEAILGWADGDNYKESRSYPKYSVDNDLNTWKPTPPAYIEAIEPHWNRIRPMILDSATQYVPEGPTPFDLDEDSRFYQELIEVYDAVKNADEEEIEIANFWDCNPYKMNLTGHVMFATKKITPGGHWIGITKIACEKTESDLLSSARAYALCSIALFDGFISCWDEKYRSKLIRPETVINEHLDENWLPILQTPPFPEHTSGHSVISSAAAIILTDIFGENFSFDDDTELQYGLEIRSFGSFKEASAEAAISRLYGGIHYRPAIDYGVDQGYKVGEFILKNIEI